MFWIFYFEYPLNSYNNPFHTCFFLYRKIDTFAKIGTRDVAIFGAKKVVLDFLKVGLELLRSCLGIVFYFKMPTFRHILARKVDIWPLKSYFRSKFGPLRRLFLSFFGSKNRFLDFWKVFLELFTSCLRHYPWL